MFSLGIWLLKHHGVIWKYTMDRDSLHFSNSIVITQDGVIYRTGNPDCYAFQYVVGVKVIPLIVLSFVHVYFFPFCFL